MGHFGERRGGGGEDGQKWKWAGMEAERRRMIGGGGGGGDRKWKWEPMGDSVGQTRPGMGKYGGRRTLFGTLCDSL